MNHNGEEETITLDQTYAVSYLSTKTPPEDLEAMILRYRPNHSRVVFELPPLRGVPESNREIENLFDVTIPHFKASAGWDLERAVARQAEVPFHFPVAEFPENYFPRYYENVTLRSLLEEYLAHHPRGDKVRLDPKTHTLVIPEPVNWQRKWKEFRKWLGI